MFNNEIVGFGLFADSLGVLKKQLYILCKLLESQSSTPLWICDVAFEVWKILFTNIICKFATCQIRLLLWLKSTVFQIG